MMMKKLLYLILCFCLIMIPSCSKKKSEEKFSSSVLGGVSNREIFSSAFFFYSDSDELMHFFNPEEKSGYLYCFDPECDHQRKTGEEVTKCTARKLSPKYVMQSNLHTYYCSGGVNTSILMQTDTDAGNEKKLDESEGITDLAFCGEHYIVRVTVDNYEFNKYNELEVREKGIVRVFVTDIKNGKTRKIFESSNYYGIVNALDIENGVLYFSYFSKHQRKLFSQHLHLLIHLNVYDEKQAPR